jgi:outer membrane protein
LTVLRYIRKNYLCIKIKKRKSKILIVLALMVAQTSYAQLESGNILLGGELSISSNGNQNTFNFAPTGYFFISDQLALGGSVGFGTSRNNPGEDDYNRFNSFGITPAARYFWNLSEQAYIYGRGSIGFSTFNSKQYTGNTTVDNFNGSQFGIGLGTGVMYILSPQLSIDLGINIINFSRSSRTTPTGVGQEVTTIDTSFRFGIDTFTPSFGLYYIIK